MKNFFVLIFFLSWSFAQAQKTEGTVKFDEKLNLHRGLDGPEAAQMKMMIPEFNINKAELLFTENESLYRGLEADDEDEITPGAGMMIKIQRPESVFFRNYETAQRTDFQDFMGKNYLIQDSLRQIPWKILEDKKDILGYACTKAIWKKSL